MENTLVVIASLYSIVMKVISGWWALCNVNLLYSNVLYGVQEINTKLLIIYCGERRSKYKLLRLSVFQISTTKRIYILKLARTNLGFENSVLKCHRTDHLFLIIFFSQKIFDSYDEHLIMVCEALTERYLFLILFM